MTFLIVSEMSVPYAVGGGEVRYGLRARELARRGHHVTRLSMRRRASLLQLPPITTSQLQTTSGFPPVTGSLCGQELRPRFNR